MSRAADPSGSSSGWTHAGSPCAVPNATERPSARRGSRGAAGSTCYVQAAHTVCRQRTGHPGRPGDRAGPGQRRWGGGGSVPAPHPQPWGRCVQHRCGTELCGEKTGLGVQRGATGLITAQAGALWSPGLAGNPTAQPPGRGALRMLWGACAAGSHFLALTALPRVPVTALQVCPTAGALPPTGRNSQFWFL